MSILVKAGAPRWVKKHVAGDDGSKPLVRADTLVAGAGAVTLVSGIVVGSVGAAVGVDTGGVAGALDILGACGSLFSGMWVFFRIDSFNSDRKYYSRKENNAIAQRKKRLLDKWVLDVTGRSSYAATVCDQAIAELKQLEGEKWQVLEQGVRTSFMQLINLSTQKEELRRERDTANGPHEVDKQYHSLVQSKLDEVDAEELALYTEIRHFGDEVHRMYTLQKMAKLQGNVTTLKLGRSNRLSEATENMKHINSALLELTQTGKSTAAVSPVILEWREAIADVTSSKRSRKI